MKRSWVATVASLSAIALIGLGAPASGAPGEDESADQAPAGTVLDSFTFVGHSPLDGFNDFGDVYAHGDFAYVGSRCSPTRQGGDGVQVIDIAHPHRPEVVSTLPNP